MKYFPLFDKIILEDDDTDDQFEDEDENQNDNHAHPKIINQVTIYRGFLHQLKLIVFMGVKA